MVAVFFPLSTTQIPGKAHDFGSWFLANQSHLCLGLQAAAKIAIVCGKIAKIERLAIIWKVVAKIAKNRKSDDF